MNTGILKVGMILSIVLAGDYRLMPPAGARSESITLQPTTFLQWQDKLARLRGEIVVVDFWATWCAPCVERFPHMVKLHEEYGRSRKIKFISMCMDDRDDPRALQRARDFLIRQNAAFNNYRMDESLPDAFEKLDLNGIPAVFIYDRAGKLRYRLTGDNPEKQFTNEDVDSAIKAMITVSGR